jgi:hypothetical protein
MTCKDCKHWTPTRNPLTGSILRSEPGVCECPVTWPELPASFNPRWINWPIRARVPGSHGAGCKMMDPKTGGGKG